ncbi:hypothetical protein ACFX5E_12840 [Flavobacterium sp. LS2P90]|uniref:Uncharacterized protein n=1 Tax=Flavobacterium xylosi TaxID=3230415 RepID=A0ABW6HZJ8_9FLAO
MKFLTPVPHSIPHLSALKSIFSKYNPNKKPLNNWILMVCVYRDRDLNSGPQGYEN